MRRHVFLTGPKRIGKSTAIRRYLEAHPHSCSGFLTVKSETVFPGSRSVHMLCVRGSADVPSADNFLFFCGKDWEATYRRFAITADRLARFDALGIACLSNLPADTDLIIMDEVGPHEAEALQFRAAILHCLDGSIPVLGVLQQADSPLYRAITARADTTVITVTEENRDQIPAMLEENEFAGNQ